VRKPNRQEFIRVHPDPEYRAELRAIVLKDDGDYYIVRPELHDALANEMVYVTLYTTMSRQGVLFLWPVRLQLPDDKPLAWWTSAREAAELAMQKWIRLASNKSLGAYDISEAQGLVAEPEWPEQTFQQIIEIAFRNGGLVDRMDHPVIKRLWGLA